jgi:choline dehydrogenase
MSQRNDDYDYVIVGSGAAGSVVAARLAELPGVRILVLEAGPSDQTVYVRMPAAMSYPLTDKRRTWQMQTGPEPGLGNRVMDHVRGRMLGGSGSLNGMVYVRGNPRDFDSWSESGADGWSYADCLPYFKKLESYDKGDDRYRGRSGPIKVTRMPAGLPVYDAMLEAGQQAGQVLNDDYNGHRQEGVHIYQANIDGGVRASGGRQYLRPAVRSGRVELRLGVLVTRILTEGRRAIGVEALEGGVLKRITAGTEVILCGGAFNSPQLLLLSGIGPRAELAAHDIGCILDLPGVGKGLTDHAAVSVAYRARRPGMSPGVGLGRLGMARIGAQWLFFRSGLGARNLWETGTFFRSSDAADYANIQHEFLPLLGEFAHGEVTVQDGFQYQTCLMRPRSRGEVTLASNDPRKLPRIVTNFLTHPVDRRDLADAVRFTDEICHQRAWDAFRGEALAPGLRKMPDEQLMRWLEERVGTQYHPCCTCRMGKDDLSVTDAQGRVHGMENLRVVDASVMPSITSGNLHCPVIMVAEKLSDAIKKVAPLQRELPRHAGATAALAKAD